MPPPRPVYASIQRLGAALPLMLDRLRIDAAHASTTIQVVMDISGVLIVCAISQAIFSGGLAFTGASTSLAMAAAEGAGLPL